MIMSSSQTQVSSQPTTLAGSKENSLRIIEEEDSVVGCDDEEDEEVEEEEGGEEGDRGKGRVFGQEAQRGGGNRSSGDSRAAKGKLCRSRQEAKLSVVIPPAQKSLVTPTIITSEFGNNEFNLIANCTNQPTPTQLFNSLVQLNTGQEVGLFTGLPSCTPTSADALVTPNGINPFFWNVSNGVSEQAHPPLENAEPQQLSEQQQLQQQQHQLQQQQHLQTNNNSRKTSPLAPVEAPRGTS